MEAIEGRLLALWNVTEEIELLEVALEDQMSCIAYNIIQYLANPMVLNLPLFEPHNYEID